MRALSRSFSAILVGLLLASAAVGQIYETVDEQGNKVFSDTPSSGAREVVLPTDNVADSPAPPGPASAATTGAPADKPGQQPHKAADPVRKSVTREGAVALMNECERQRKAKIAPLREQAIEDCISNGYGDRQYCERFNESFGDPTARAGGGMVPGMFWELPVCEQAVAAEKHFMLNPNSRSFNLP